MTGNEAKKCSSCGADVEDYGVRTFRIGGLGGEMAYLIGDIAEIEEEPMPIHVYICPSCGKMELFANEKTKKIILSRRGLKRCIKCGKNIPLAAEECYYCGTKQKNV